MGYGYFPYIQGGVSPIIKDASGQQLIGLSHTGGATTLVGAEATGDDLILKCNSVDDYPVIRLNGGTYFNMNYGVGYYLSVREGTVVKFKFENSTGVSRVIGSLISGEDLELKANDADTYSFIKLNGNGWVDIEGSAGSGLNLKENGTSYASFEENTDFQIQTYSDRNIFLDPDGSGKVKFGTYAAGVAGDSTGYITIKDASGTDRKLMVQA